MGKQKKEQNADLFVQSSEASQQSNSREQKTKKLNKGQTKSRKNDNPANKKKPRKIEHRDLSGVKLGRPSLESTNLSVAEDPTSDMQECLLSYLDKIGLKHGLVFRPQDRVKLNNEPGNQIKWNPTHQWKKENQRNKIHTNQKTMKIIKNFVTNQPPITTEDMIDIFLNISCLFADECTNQIYTILSQVLESLINDQQIPERKNRANQLFQRIIFFSGTFTRVYIKYWIQIPKRKVERQNMRSNFINMFCDLVKMTQICMKKTEQIQQYLQQERTMQMELNKIIEKAQNSQKMDQFVEEIYSGME